jgi:hypothetical protein
MDNETKSAIQKSISKWELIATRQGWDDGSKNCALCKKFHTDGITCPGCPVYELTQAPCTRKPSMYGEWYDHHIREHESISPFP